MKRLISNESLAYIGHLKNVLEQDGITCIIKNSQLSGALGEIPFLECLPEIWVVADADLSRATEILAELETPLADAEEWRCGSCKELNEPQFAACWNCGTATAVGD
jgi:hypothetical protein